MQQVGTVNATLLYSNHPARQQVTLALRSLQSSVDIIHEKLQQLSMHSIHRAACTIDTAAYSAYEDTQQKHGNALSRHAKMTWRVLLVEAASDLQASVVAAATQVKASFVWAVLTVVAAPLDGIQPTRVTTNPASISTESFCWVSLTHPHLGFACIKGTCSEPAYA